MRAGRNKRMKNKARKSAERKAERKKLFILFLATFLFCKSNY